MKDYLGALGEFFNDFIGNVVPGTVLLALLWLFFEWPISTSDAAASSTAAALLWIALSYAIGHALSATADVASSRLAAVGLAVDEDAQLKDLEKRGLVEEARAALHVSPTLQLSGREIRSKLMTASKESKQLAVRFMHIALLCNGVAVALVMALVARLYGAHVAPSVLRIQSPWMDLYIQTAAMLLLAVVLLKRGKAFRSRSFNIPFTVGPEEIRANAAADSAPATKGTKD